MGQLHSGPMAGRTVLATAASGGIGKATALGLARMGADLAICGPDPESTEDAAGELSAAGGGPVEVFMANLPAQMEVRRAGQVLQRLPRIEVLVNNVGGTGTPAMSPPTGWSAPSPQPSGAVPAHQPAPRPMEAERPGAGGHRLRQRPGPSGRIDFDDLQGERSHSAARAYRASSSHSRR